MAALRLSANAFVRAAPRAGSAPLGVAHRGDALVSADRITPDGWHAVHRNGRIGWVWGGMVELEK